MTNSSLFDVLVAFSCAHCLGICGVMVPLNLLMALQSMIWAALGRERRWPIATLGMACCGGLVLHVLAWFWMGVVMAPTFVLLGLSGLCLGIHLWATTQPDRMGRFLRWVWARAWMFSFALGRAQ